MKFRNIALVAALVGATLSPSVFAQLDAPLDPSTPPPALLDEAVPLQPGPGYVWSPGYWSLGTGRYDWTGGSWMLPGYDYGLHFHIGNRPDHGFKDHDRAGGEGHPGEPGDHLAVHIGHEGGHGL
jgi:hypothetical protein